MLFPRPASEPIQVGPYTLTECIGQGGMAVVYKATRQGPGDFEKTVVVKAMLPGLAQKRDLVELFRAEARLMAQLDHPNIVQVHDAGMAGAVPYLVMEYLNGRNLTQLRTALHAGGERLPVDAAVAIMRHVCRALGYAHEFTDAEGQRRQIIHRDVSPSNVMVCRDGTVKLLDFGVAKITGEFDREATRSFRGKYAYMAPEQVLRGPIDRRIDVFAAGIVLHELLTGRRLFACDSELETLERVVRAEVPPPSRENPDVPRALDAVVLKALRRDPMARYRNGSEMADALEQCGVRAAGRRALTELMARVHPVGSVTCEVCGKAVLLGALCDECGTAAPLDPAMGGMSDDEPEPLLPPPSAPRGDSARRGVHLRLVRPVGDSAPLVLPPPVPDVRGARPRPYDIEPASEPLSIGAPSPSVRQEDTHENEVSAVEREASSIPTGVDLTPAPLGHEPSVPTMKAGPQRVVPPAIAVAVAAAQRMPALSALSALSAVPALPATTAATPTAPEPASAPSVTSSSPPPPMARLVPVSPSFEARPIADSAAVPSLSTPPRALLAVVVSVTVLAAAGAIALVLWLGGKSAARPVDPPATAASAATAAPPSAATPIAIPAAPPTFPTPTATVATPAASPSAASPSAASRAAASPSAASPSAASRAAASPSAASPSAVTPSAPSPSSRASVVSSPATSSTLRASASPRVMAIPTAATTNASHESVARKRRERPAPSSSAATVRSGRLVDPFAGAE